MRGNLSSAPKIVGAVLLAWAVAVNGSAQEEDALVGGDFVETTIAGRPAALRLRAEVQYTDDDIDLLADDVNYARFPSRMYSFEAKVFQSDRSAYSASYSEWCTRQDLEYQQWAWKAWVPLSLVEGDREYHLTVRGRTTSWTADPADRTSLYLGVDRTSADGMYAYLQYRWTVEGVDYSGQELYEYLSWRPTGKFRIGEQAAISGNDDEPGTRPWYASLFATVFLLPETTSLRVEARHVDSGEDLKYDRYNAYLYQRVGMRSLVRFSYRLYQDNGGLSSRAYGIKFGRYFSARLSAHVGYRFYDHSEGIDLNTVYGGIQVIL